MQTASSPTQSSTTKKLRMSNENITITEFLRTSTSVTLDAKSLNRYSRQNAALGAETTAKLTKMKVLIYGVRGVGIETAKNLALQGAGAITIVDSNPVTIQDLGVNFFLLEEEIGKSRGSVVQPKLQDLNPICSINVADTLTDNLILQHSCVVITQHLELKRLVEIDNLCRGNNISFLFGYSNGLASTIFVDHGMNHFVNDKDGEKPVQKIIVDITSIHDSNELLIRYETPEGQPAITISSGNFEITEVVGIPSINQHFEIKHLDNDPVKTVRIPYDFANKCPIQYISGGLITEKKVPTPYPMESLASKIKEPGSTFDVPQTLVLTDLINFGREYQQHVAFIALTKFYEVEHRLPFQHGYDVTNDMTNVMNLAKNLIDSKDINISDFEIDEKFITSYMKFSSLEIHAVSAFLGGVLAQEVVKCTGKLTPIPGFMHFSSFESLNDDDLVDAERQYKDTRYDELAALYGWKFVEKLQNSKYFMVGCGALGCEFLKNFALCGLACGPEGKLTVTDPDHIELSNLSRQFLFREHNVGQSKSRAASNMAKVMNKTFNIEPLELLVSSKSEDTFTDQFWNSLDGVCNALDNIEARFYIDTQCVKYEKSLLESGTMGTGGNIDTIVPFKTRTYREGGNASEGGGVPMCTLRNFPHITDHCIEWSRDQFEYLFVKLPKICESYLINPMKFENDMNIKAGTEPGVAYFEVRGLSSFVRTICYPSVGNCVKLAFDFFHYLFRDRILDLQASFPLNSRMVDKNGVDKGPFWGEKRRYPTACVFNPNDESHVNFIISATCLFGVAVGQFEAKKQDNDDWLREFREQKDWVLNIISGLEPPEYIQAPVNTEGLENHDKANPPSKEIVQNTMKTLFSELNGYTLTLSQKGNGIDGNLPVSEGGLIVLSADKIPKFEIAEFEKDDDANCHISFITSTANLRCDNYSIKRTDFHACKIIAGRIIAALATTTAAVCGLVMLELFKVVLNKPTDALMNRQIGLASNTFTSFTQEEPKKFKSHVVVTYPDPSESSSLPSDAYDEKGILKDEYVTKTTKKAYPEGHSVWDKITCSGYLTLKQFSEWLLEEHSLKLNKWDFVLGYKTDIDPDSKVKITKPFSSPVYPPKLKLDYSLLPSLDLTLVQATQAIMRNPKCKPTQQYISLWKEAKNKGELPIDKETTDFEITEGTTLKEILNHMSSLADDALGKNLIETKVVTSLSSRTIWIIPGSEAPSVQDSNTGEEVEYLCSIKITL